MKLSSIARSRRKFFSSCTCCLPEFAADSPKLARRDFLAGGIAALGAAAGAPAARAQAPIAKTRIDVHHHYLPPAHKEALDRHKQPSPKWSLQMSLEDMDKSGIGLSVLSQVQPGAWFGDAEESRKLCRASSTITAPRWCATIPAGSACSRPSRRPTPTAA